MSVGKATNGAAARLRRRRVNGFFFEGGMSVKVPAVALAPLPQGGANTEAAISFATGYGNELDFNGQPRVFPCRRNPLGACADGHKTRRRSHQLSGRGH